MPEIMSLWFVRKANGMYKRNYSFKIIIMVPEMFLIKSCIEILANNTNNIKKNLHQLYARAYWPSVLDSVKQYCNTDFAVQYFEFHSINISVHFSSTF